MEGFDHLIVIAADYKAAGKLPLLAQSLTIKTEIANEREKLTKCLSDNSLLALPFYGFRLDKYSVPENVRELIKLAPLFLYDIEEQFVDPQIALTIGIRGLVGLKRPMDQQLHALKVMMLGQLYYARDLLSRQVDTMLHNYQNEQMLENDISMFLMLTRQEKRVIELVSLGARNKEIACKLNISSHTVKAHLSSIFRKTQSRNRVELLRWASQFHLESSSISF